MDPSEKQQRLRPAATGSDRHEAVKAIGRVRWIPAGRSVVPRTPPYEYRAIIKRVIDGDTFTADVNLGFNTWIHDQSFRLLGCNAREHDQPGGQEAIANLNAVMPVGSSILLASVKADKYGGRYDAIVTLPDGHDLTELLIETGWVAAWTGAGAKPIPPWPRPEVGTS